MPDNYLVRTIFLQNYFSPASEMADLRRENGNMKDLVGAMKRTELATSTLEKELNGFAERNLQIVSIIPHPYEQGDSHDLLITIVLSETS